MKQKIKTRTDQKFVAPAISKIGYFFDTKCLKILYKMSFVQQCRFYNENKWKQFLDNPQGGVI